MLVEAHTSLEYSKLVTRTGGGSLANIWPLHQDRKTSRLSGVTSNRCGFLAIGEITRWNMVRRELTGVGRKLRIPQDKK